MDLTVLAPERVLRPSAGPARLATAVGVLLVVGVAGLLHGHEGYVADRTLPGLAALGFGTLGPWVWLRAVPVIGARMGAVGLGAAANWAAQCWSGTLVGGWASQWTWFWPLLGIPLVLTRFPDGRAPGGRLRFVEPVLLVAAVAASVLLAVAAFGAPRTLVADPTAAAPAWSRLLLRLALLTSAVWVVTLVVLLGALAREAVRRTGVARGQLLTLGCALLATVGGLVGLVLVDGPAFQVVVALALPVGIGAAVLRYALYDLDLLVHRFAVWAALTAVVVGATAGVVWWVSGAVPGRWSRALQVLVLSALVLALDPVRRLAQRGFGRLLYGRRDAPAEALAVLGRGLGTATAQQSREELCRSVATTLALPWVGLRSVDGLVTGWGRPTSAPFELPLGAGADTLLLGPRRAGERFGEADLRVVRAMSAQVEVAVRALDAADDLQRARDGLVRSREEERRRLRNDLHDGVGPTLAGIRMQVRALSARNRETWEQVDADLEGCSAEIARVIEGLRPPVLDDGLVQAVQREATRWSGSAVQVDVAADGLTGGRSLPAAVEIAAYRIVGEAVSNAVRHGRARTVTVELTGRGEGAAALLEVRVRDDGTGVVVPRDGGVGLSSMRERAEELGGTLALDGVPGTGTTVSARLPLGVTTAVAR